MLMGLHVYGVDTKLVIARNAKTDYAIMIPSQPSPAEQYAAQELSCFLAESTGAQFSIIKTDKVGTTPSIIIGYALAKQVMPDATDYADLGNDGIIIKTQNNNLILTGGPKATRGTLNAVYTFLEDIVGCRWWTPADSYIPKLAELSIDKLDIRYIPEFLYQRNPLFASITALSPNWCARNKCFGAWLRLQEKHGGQPVYKPCYHHTFNHIVPAGTYFEKHPEWFSEINGKRLGKNTQLCLTNPELQKFFVTKAKEILRGSSVNTVLCVSQNDNSNYCRCAKCKAVDNEEGTPSGNIIRFVNMVADSIKDEFPGVRVETLAYQYSRVPPAITKVAPGVSVCIAPIERSFGEPISESSNKEFADAIKKWSQISNRLEIWDYVANFRHQLMPFPNLKTIGPNMRFYAAHNVKGVFAEGYHYGKGGDLCELRAWLLAKLLWNPQLDDNKLIEEFVNGFYGKNSGPYIISYIELLSNAVKDATKAGYLLKCNTTSIPFLSLELLKKSDVLFKKALDAAENDLKLEERIKIARLPLQYAILLNSPVIEEELAAEETAWPFSEDKNKMLQEFCHICEKNELSLTNRKNDKRDFAKFMKLVSAGQEKKVIPPFCSGLKRDGWLEFQESSFDYWMPNVLVFESEDKLASNGTSAWMPGTHVEWALNLQVPELFLNKAANNSSWEVFISARADMKSTVSGKAFEAGCYDAETKTGERKTINVNELSSSEYRYFKVASTSLKRTKFIWVAPFVNTGVDKIWIDRIILVKKH